MNAWLVTWDWVQDAAAVADKVAAILNPRWSADRVACIVEFLYAKRTATASEIAAYASRPSRNPYRAERDSYGGIICGHHPWLHARIVFDLKISENPETGIETLTWTEQSLYKRGEDGRPEMVRDRMPAQTTRRITGALSDELIYDRAKGEFKPGWEPDTVNPLR